MRGHCAERKSDDPKCVALQSDCPLICAGGYFFAQLEFPSCTSDHVKCCALDTARTHEQLENHYGIDM